MEDTLPNDWHVLDEWQSDDSLEEGEIVDSDNDQANYRKRPRSRTQGEMSTNSSSSKHDNETEDSRSQSANHSDSLRTMVLKAKCNISSKTRHVSDSTACDRIDESISNEDFTESALPKEVPCDLLACDVQMEVPLTNLNLISNDSEEDDPKNRISLLSERNDVEYDILANIIPSDPSDIDMLEGFNESDYVNHSPAADEQEDSMRDTLYDTPEPSDASNIAPIDSNVSSTSMECDEILPKARTNMLGSEDATIHMMSASMGSGSYLDDTEIEKDPIVDVTKAETSEGIEFDSDKDTPARNVFDIFAKSNDFNSSGAESVVKSLEQKASKSDTFICQENENVNAEIPAMETDENCGKAKEDENQVAALEIGVDKDVECDLLERSKETNLEFVRSDGTGPSTVDEASITLQKAVFSEETSSKKTLNQEGADKIDIALKICSVVSLNSLPDEETSENGDSIKETVTAGQSSGDISGSNATITNTDGMLKQSANSTASSSQVLPQLNATSGNQDSAIIKTKTSNSASARRGPSKIADLCENLLQAASKNSSGDSNFIYECGFVDCRYDAQTSSAFLMHHLAQHRSESCYSCAVCVHSPLQLTFKSCDDLIKHIDDSHQERYRCLSCKLTFHGQERLHAHMLELHKKNTTFHCVAAGCTFKSTVLAKFRAHCTDAHQRAVSHVCFTCGARFTDVHSLMRHLEAGVVRLIGCPHCTVICKMKEKQQMLQHVVSQHPLAARTIVVTVFVNCWQKVICCEQQSSTHHVKGAIEQALMSNRIHTPHELVRDVLTPQLVTEKRHTARKSCRDNKSPASDGERVQPLILVRNTSPGSSERNADQWQQKRNVDRCVTQYNSGVKEERNMVSEAGRNMVSAGEMHMVSDMGRNMVSSMGGLTAAGGNMMSAFGRNMVPAIGGNMSAFGRNMLPVVAGNMVSAARGNMVSSQGGNMLSAFGRNMMPAVGGSVMSVGEGGKTLALKQTARKSTARNSWMKTKDAPYTCVTCTQVCSTLSDLKSHVKTHTKVRHLRLYRCLHCDCVMSRMDGIERHLATVHSHQQLRFEVYDELLAVPPSRTRLSCPRCDFTTTDVGSYGAHTCTQQYACQICPYRTTRGLDWTRHQLSHSAQVKSRGEFRCGACEYTAVVRSAVVRHANRYHPQEPVRVLQVAADPENEDSQPVIVGRKGVHSFASSKKLRRCRHCSYYTYNKHHYERHIACHLVRLTTGHRCHYCDYRSVCKSAVVRHIRGFHLGKAVVIHKMGGEASSRSDAVGNDDGIDVMEQPDIDNSTQIAMEPPAISNSSEIKATPTAVQQPIDAIVIKKEPGLAEVPLEPLVEDIISDRRASKETEAGEIDGDDVGDTAPPADEHEYCVRDGDNYRCAKCDFIHRFPSKVRRHYRYRHAPTFPYHCGYCDFRAVESGKVKRHCSQIHSTEPNLVMRHSADQSSVEMVGGGDTCGEDVESDTWVRAYIAKSSQAEGNLQKCRACSYTQHGASSLKRHVLAKHLRFYPYECGHCGLKQIELNKVRRHIERAHPVAPYSVIKHKYLGRPTEPMTSVHDSENESENDFRNELENNPQNGEIQPEAQHEAGSEANSMGALAVTSDVESVLLRPDQIKLEPSLAELAEVDMENVMSLSTVTPIVDEVNRMMMNTSQPYPTEELSIKEEPVDTTLIESLLMAPSSIPHTADMTPPGTPAAAAAPLGRGRTYCCLYCQYTSLYSVADVRKHVFNVHLRRTPPKRSGLLEARLLSDSVGPLWLSEGGIRMVGVLGTEGKGVEDITEAVKSTNELVERIAEGLVSFNAGSTAEEIQFDDVDEEFSPMVPPQHSQQTIPNHYTTSPSAASPVNTSRSSLLLNMLSANDSPNISAEVQLPTTSSYHPFGCTFCDYSSSSALDIREHSLTVHQVEQERVRFLERPPEAAVDSGTDTAEIAKQTETTSNEMGYSCGHCGKSHFESAEAVAAHVIAVHSMAPPSHQQTAKRSWVSTEADSGVGSSNKVRRVSSSSPASRQSPGPAQRPMPVTAPSPSRLKSTTLQHFCCLHCNFTSPQNLVMRHHVMAHLRYRPYCCPYCDAVRSVKSYPIHKHIAAHHPNLANRYMLEKDADLEEKVRQSFIRQPIPIDDNGPITIANTGMRPAPVLPSVPERAPPGGLLAARSHTCLQCSYTCPVESVMRRHVMAHLHYRPFACPHCSNWAAVKAYPVRQHILSKHPGLADIPAYLRDEAMEEKVTDGYQRPNITDSHRPMASSLSVSPVKPLINSIIEPSTKSESPKQLTSVLGSPSRAALGAPYQCTECGYSTRHRVDMRSHVFTELGYRPHVCTHCGHRFFTSKALRRHLTRKDSCGAAPDDHGAMEKDPEMEQRVTQRLFESQQHHQFGAYSRAQMSPPRAIKTMEPPVTTDTTNEITNCTTPMTTSIQRPLAIRLHKCTQCNYTSRERRLLVTHALRHRPQGYTCDGCGARFHYPSEFRRHAPTCRSGKPVTMIRMAVPVARKPLVPAVARPVVPLRNPRADASRFPVMFQVSSPPVLAPSGLYECPYCPYQHRDIQLYRKHIKIHGPRNWQCNHCEKTFHVLDRLRRHCRQAHANLPFIYRNIATGETNETLPEVGHYVNTPDTPQIEYDTPQIEYDTMVTSEDDCSSSSSSSQPQRFLAKPRGAKMRLQLHDVMKLSEFELSQLLRDTDVSSIHHVDVE